MNRARKRFFYAACNSLEQKQKQVKCKSAKLRLLSALFLFYFWAFGFFAIKADAQDLQDVKRLNKPETQNATPDAGKPQAQEAGIPDNQQKTISLDFKDASLKDILKIFSIQTGINFIASQEVEDRTVTLYMENIPVKDAMENLFKANNLDYDYNEAANIMLVRKQQQTLNLITKVFMLKHASVASSLVQGEVKAGFSCSSAGGGGDDDDDQGIAGVITKLLSSNGSLVEDSRTNSLIVTDISTRFPAIEKAIEELDISIPQIMLEVEMLDVKKSIVDSLGFQFGDNPLTIITAGKGGNKGFIGDFDLRGITEKVTDTVSDVVLTPEGSLAIGESFSALLDLMRQDSHTKSLARPRILTLNNVTAVIAILTDEVIGEIVQLDDEGNETAKSPERIETGVSLRITPQVNPGMDEITMFLAPSVTEAAPSAFDPTEYRDPEKRQTRSLVKVSDGETVIIGGLIRKKKYETYKKVPILGDIPLVGILFRHKETETDVERELLVFITPRIVKDVSASPFTQGNNAILSSREQDAP